MVRWREYPGAPEKGLTFAKKVEADAYKAKIEHELNIGAYVDPKAGLQPFGEFAEQWMSDGAAAGASRRRKSCRWMSGCPVAMSRYWPHIELRTPSASMVPALMASKVSIACAGR